MRTITRQFHATVLLTLATVAFAQTDPLSSCNDGKAKQPGIFIMGDDIGMWDIGAYHRAFQTYQSY